MNPVDESKKMESDDVYLKKVIQNRSEEGPKQYNSSIMRVAGWLKIKYLYYLCIFNYDAPKKFLCIPLISTTFVNFTSD